MKPGPVHRRGAVPERRQHNTHRHLVRGVASICLLVLVGACTVRVELASPRAAPGDLAASSTGLTGHGRWFERTPAAPDQPSYDGVAIADIRAIDRQPHLLVRLPSAADRSMASDPEQQDEMHVAAARLLPVPPPSKPVDMALRARDERRHALVAAVLRPGPAAPSEGRRPAQVVGSPGAASGAPATSERAAAQPRPSASALPASHPAAELALAPGVELLRPGGRYDLARMTSARSGSAAGASAAEPDPPFGSLRRAWAAFVDPRREQRARAHPGEPIRLFRMPWAGRA